MFREDSKVVVTTVKPPANASSGGPGLQDRWGRRFEYLRLSVTEACNYRCNYCLPNGYRPTSIHPDDRPMTLSEIETLVRAFAAMGTRKIRLTGGEPATRRDLGDIIRLCKSIPGIESVVLTTNGYNLRRQVDDWQRAGLDGLNVSIDSLERERFREITGHDHLPRVLAGLERALELGFRRVKTNAVILRQFNLEQFEHFLDFVRERPITARFIELMQTGDNGVFFRENHVTGAELLARLESGGWQEGTRDALSGPAREFRHPAFQGGVGLILPYSPDFCRTCNRLRISASGRLHLCLFASEGVSLRRHLREGDLVSVVRDTRLLLEGKAAGHSLHQGATGATDALAQLGG